jgi:hypothetical protein
MTPAVWARVGGILVVGLVACFLIGSPGPFFIAAVVAAGAEWAIYDDKRKKQKQADTKPTDT